MAGESSGLLSERVQGVMVGTTSQPMSWQEFTEIYRTYRMAKQKGLVNLSRLTILRLVELMCEVTEGENPLDPQAIPTDQLARFEIMITEMLEFIGNLRAYLKETGILTTT